MVGGVLLATPCLRAANASSMAMKETLAKGKGVKTNIHFEENHNEHQCGLSGGALIKSTVK